MIYVCIYIFGYIFHFFVISGSQSLQRFHVLQTSTGIAKMEKSQRIGFFKASQSCANRFMTSFRMPPSFILGAPELGFLDRSGLHFCLKNLGIGCAKITIISMAVNVAFGGRETINQLRRESSFASSLSTWCSLCDRITFCVPRF